MLVILQVISIYAGLPSNTEQGCFVSAEAIRVFNLSSSEKNTLTIE